MMIINRRTVLGGLAAIPATAAAGGALLPGDGPDIGETPITRLRRLCREATAALDERNASSPFEPVALMIYPASHNGPRVVLLEEVAYPGPDKWRAGRL